MIIRFGLVAVAAVLALSACSKQGDDTKSQAPEVKLTPQPAVTAAADGTRFTDGQWNIEENGAGASAAFTKAGSAAAVVLVCERASKTLRLSVAGSSGPETMRIEAAGQKADVALTRDQRGASAVLDVSQPILANWTDPKNVISFSSPSGVSLKLPGNAAIRRVITACE